jgi:hypothetical protein
LEIYGSPGILKFTFYSSYVALGSLILEESGFYESPNLSGNILTFLFEKPNTIENRHWKHLLGKFI